MFTTENLKSGIKRGTRRFDYDAYIKGRLQGIYVIAYIDDEAPEDEHLTISSIEDQPTTDTLNATAAVTKKVEKNKSAGYATVMTVKLANVNLDSPTEFKLLPLSNNLEFPTQGPTQNCRGAPITVS